MSRICPPFALLLALLTVAAPLASQAPGARLHVVIVDGEEAANVVQEKMAAEPVVEVRDDADRKVVGAVVRFTIRRTMSKRLSAAFRGGKDEVRTLTDATGRARTGALTPLEPGRFEIEVQVTHNGQSATATIRHTNFSSAAQARAAGREPSQGSNPTAAAAGGGAAAVSAGGGIGLGKLALIGLAVGGAGAGAVVASNRDEGESGGRITAVTPSATSGIQSVTSFGFSVQTADFAATALSFLWEFGDGGTSSEPAPTHVYAAAGSYSVAVTVSDGRQSAKSQSSVAVYSLSGTWASAEWDTTLVLTQFGPVISGVGAIQNYTQCTVSGSLQGGSPAVVMNRPACSRPPFASLIPAEYRLDLSADGRGLSGMLTRFTSAGPIGSDAITLRRQ